MFKVILEEIIAKIEEQIESFNRKYKYADLRIEVCCGSRTPKKMII